MISESVIRERVRQHYRETGELEYRNYPAFSQERLVALSECQKIYFDDEFRNIEGCDGN